SCFLPAADFYRPTFALFGLYRGHLKAAWSNVYPNGVIYYLEPEEVTSTDPVVNFTWSADSFSKPHRLRVVPISITEQFISRKPGSTWSRDHFDSGDNEKSNEEMPTTTNDTVQSSTHTMASGLLGHIRQRRGQLLGYFSIL
ncbi:hypothetical protein FGIG_12085, partial [Fasciola gigantica]